jgi:ketosteroid isomerase-like protein
LNGLRRYGFNLMVALLGALVLSAPVGASTGTAAEGQIPDLFVSMGGGTRSAYALVVEKDSQKITLFKYDGRYRAVETVKCSTGKIRGDKRVSGDKKTPEGVYFFTEAFTDRELAPLYGTRAFPLDYPNFMDRRQGRNGYAIWLHGTNRPLKDRDSNGCIALENKDIDKLSNYIALQNTPILITENVRYKPFEQAAAEDKAIRAFLSGWNRALAKGSYHDYLAFYDSGYLPDMSWWMQWQKARGPGEYTFGNLDTGLNYLGIYKHRKLYIALFDQQVSVDGLKAVAGRRKIFVSFDSGNPLIVGDTFMAPAAANRKEATSHPLLAAARALRSRHSGDEAIAALVERWLAAWRGKDISAYGDCYSSRFKSNRMDRKMWLDYKQRLNKAYSYIKVTGEDIKISRNADTAIVTFLQTYASNAHKAKGIKTLILKMENGKWKIFRETFKRN